MNATRIALERVGVLGSCEIRLGQEFGYKHTPLNVGMEVDDCTASTDRSGSSDA